MWSVATVVDNTGLVALPLVVRLAVVGVNQNRDSFFLIKIGRAHV